MPWLNNDGLYVKFGREAGVAGTSGGFGELEGGAHVLELNIDLTKLTSTAAIIDDNLNFPSDYTILEVDVIDIVGATSGGSATLSIGLVRRDRSTNISDTALVNALAVATIGTAGKVTALTAGVAGAGTSLGATAGFPAYITAKYGTAAFTAGTVKVRVFYQKI